MTGTASVATRCSPTSIHLSWRAKHWSYRLTWGPRDAPRFEIFEDLEGNLGRNTRIDELYVAIARQAKPYLRNSTYELAGDAPCVWTIRRGRKLRHAAPTRPRTMRATDGQVARWITAAGDRPWSAWAVEQLDIAAREVSR